MTATYAAAAPPKASKPPIDWVELLSSAFVAASLHMFAQAVAAQNQAEKAAQATKQNARRQQAPKRAQPYSSASHHREPPPVVRIDEEAAAAASTLGVSVKASEDEVRAALRARLASSKIHPDQGGDGEEAKRLIAAKNLLVARKRAARE